MFLENFKKIAALSHSKGMKALAGILVVFLGLACVNDSGFLEKQLNHQRVKQAYDKKESLISYRLSEKGVDKQYFEIYLRAFKQEQAMEVWVKNSHQTTWKLLHTYPICTTTGFPGPKRRQGDKQIPEGFYEVQVFNPQSEFHLSLGINYPNKSDSFLGSKEALGGDIYIHGGCETIGCLPLTDDKIEEVYLLCTMAKNAGQKNIPVHIFPNRMNLSNYKYLIDKTEDNNLRRFWGNIRTGYLLFEQNGALPEISVNVEGVYEFKQE